MMIDDDDYADDELFIVYVTVLVEFDSGIK